MLRRQVSYDTTLGNEYPTLVAKGLQMSYLLHLIKKDITSWTSN